MQYDFTDRLLGDFSDVKLTRNEQGGIDIEVDNNVLLCVCAYELDVQSEKIPTLTVTIGVKTALVEDGIPHKY